MLVHLFHNSSTTIMHGRGVMYTQKQFYLSWCCCTVYESHGRLGVIVKMPSKNHFQYTCLRWPFYIWLNAHWKPCIHSMPTFKPTTKEWEYKCIARTLRKSESCHQWLWVWVVWRVPLRQKSIWGGIDSSQGKVLQGLTIRSMVWQIENNLSRRACNLGLGPIICRGPFVFGA